MAVQKSQDIISIIIVTLRVTQGILPQGTVTMWQHQPSLYSSIRSVDAIITDIEKFGSEEFCCFLPPYNTYILKVSFPR
ncbi:hypothetical protein RRG08_025142 [Elysia crispata]|uniref:Uncharacterized protein n=1 Tax=Elysia crispata TaxID=231223 RepID=A0AAE1CVN1_9GAST|nr:hypothetical protein RRG08_025142 [Elysia crispata]